MNNFKSEMRALIIYLLLFTLIIAIVAYFLGIKTGEVDVLAFLGSIIGGVITLAGVYLTIRSSYDGLRLTLIEQEMIRFSENYPKKMKHLSEITSTINRIYQRDLKNASPNELSRLPEVLEPLIDEAVYVDGSVYETVKYMHRYVKSSIDPLFNSDNPLYIKNDFGDYELVPGREEEETRIKDNLRQFLVDILTGDLNIYKGKMRDKFVEYTKQQ